MNRNDRGKLIKVQIGPHRFAKMYEQDAIERGLVPIPGRLPSDKGQKAKPQAENKMLAPAEDKAAVHELPPREEWEDFTEVPGIGKATCQALYAHGIHTWDDLLAGDIGFLSGKPKAVIEEWRAGIGQSDETGEEATGS